MADNQNAVTGASRAALLRMETPETGDRELAMFLLTLPPGGAAPIHQHPGIGIGYVLEGLYGSQYEGESVEAVCSRRGDLRSAGYAAPDRTEWQQH